MAILNTLLHLSQTALTLYTLRYSREAINLLTGGDTAQKVAKYSNKAALQVIHTKGTQSAGVICLITSFLLSLFLASSAWLEGLELGQTTRMGLNLGEASLIVGSVLYIRNFWKARAKVPMERAQEYNQAITKTNLMNVHLAYLGILWGVSASFEVLNFLL